MDYKKEIIDSGDNISRVAHQINMNSFNNCPAIKVVPHQPGNFRGAVGIRPADHILQQMLLGNMSIEIQNDGAGHKPQFFAISNEEEDFMQLAWEVITMTIDDLARTGCFPVSIACDLQAKKITRENVHLAEAMFKGFGDILKQTGIVCTTGESAIMKHSITSFFDYDDLAPDYLLTTMSGTAMGFSHKDALIDGSGIKAGMPIVGFWEPGMRCNGASWMIDLIKEVFIGKDCPRSKMMARMQKSSEAMEFIRMLTIPSQSYAKLITRLVGWQQDGSLGNSLAGIEGIAHITGGGVVSKLGEILPGKMGAYLDKMPMPCDLLLQAQALSERTGLYLSDERAYETFHGGCGMMVVANSDKDADTIIKEAYKDNVSARVIGETIESGVILIKSKFRNQDTIQKEKGS